MIKKNRFIWGFLNLFCLFVATNIATYLNTMNAMQMDGQTIAGFPFVFHRVGGDCHPRVCDTYVFHAGYFAANIAIGLIIAIVVGLAGAWSKNNQRT